MNRRSFFSSLAGLAAAAAVDPEKLLWTPGKKLVSIPPVMRFHKDTFTLAWKPLPAPMWLLGADGVYQIRRDGSQARMERISRVFTPGLDPNTVRIVETYVRAQKIEMKAFIQT